MTITDAARYAARFGYTFRVTPDGYQVEHWTGKNHATLPTIARAVRCCEAGRRITPARARAIMAEAGATDLGELRAAERSAIKDYDRLRFAEAYTVLSAANMPEARAYFGAMFDLKEARP